MKKSWNAVILITLLFLGLFQPANVVHADNSRDNAFVCCLYDEQTMNYVVTVLYSATEVEKAVFLNNYDMVNSSAMKTIYGSTIFGSNNTVYKDRTGGSGDNVNSAASQGGFYLTQTGFEGVDWSDASGSSDSQTVSDFGNAKTAPLTFPSYSRNAADADINRAYSVAESMGGDLTNALLFINDGNSYRAVGDRQYLMEMRYFLLKDMNPTATSTGTKHTSDSRGGGEGVVTNTYGSQYKIQYDVPVAGKVTITYTGHYAKKKSNGVSSSGTASGQVYFSPNAQAWDESSFVAKKNGDSQTFTYKVKKGYTYPETNFEDGTLNNLSGRNGSKFSDDNIYINWANLVVEADYFYSKGYTYSNYGDLATKSAGENMLIRICSNALASLRSALGCFATNDLVFNKGVFSTDAYVYGVFPSLWIDNMSVFYLISVIIALSTTVIAVIVLVTKNGVASGGINPGARFTLIQGFYEMVLTAIIMGAFLPILWIILNLMSLITNIFAAIGEASGRTLETLCPINNYGTIAGILLSAAFFAINLYINIVYIIRRIVLLGLVCLAPIFIMFYMFGEKGKLVTQRWLSELIGNLLIQPFHAAVFAFILTVCVGLRGIEALTLVACIIPVTNMYRSIITRGGGLTTSLAGKLSAASIGGMAMAGGTAISAVGGAVGGAVQLAGGALGPIGAAAGQTLGGMISGAGNVAGGLASGAAGFGAMALGDEGVGTASSNVNTGIRQVGAGVGQVTGAAGRMTSGLGAAGFSVSNTASQVKAAFNDSEFMKKYEDTSMASKRGNFSYGDVKNQVDSIYNSLPSTVPRWDSSEPFSPMTTGDISSNGINGLSSYGELSFGTPQSASLSNANGESFINTTVSKNGASDTQRVNFDALQDAYRQAMDHVNSDSTLSQSSPGTQTHYVNSQLLKNFGVRDYSPGKNGTATFNIPNTTGLSNVSVSGNGLNMAWDISKGEV